MRTVHAFGDEALTPSTVRAALAEIVDEAASAIVVSAFAGVVDRLLEQAERAVTGHHDRVVIERCCLMPTGDDVLQGCPSGERLLGTLLDVLRAVTLLGELSGEHRRQVRAMGARFAATWVTAQLEACGVHVHRVDTVDRGLPVPLPQNVELVASGGSIPIVTGGVGREGSTTVFVEPDGADVTAVGVAASSDADRLILWKNVEVLHHVDPRVRKHSDPVSIISREEARALALLGRRYVQEHVSWQGAPHLEAIVRSVADPGWSLAVRSSRTTLQDRTHPVVALVEGAWLARRPEDVGRDEILRIEASSKFLALGCACEPGVSSRPIDLIGLVSDERRVVAATLHEWVYRHGRATWSVIEPALLPVILIATERGYGVSAASDLCEALEGLGSP
ncbi:MAG: hypothetical protein H6834_13040 [Planctomycetes bacterium]|nr:hypothetical protein [Planctomycetota bacterium]